MSQKGSSGTGKSASTKPSLSGSASAAPRSFSFFGLVADVVLSYLFWTTLTMLVPTIWFAPMDKMGATDSGDEFFYLLAFTSPLLLVLPPVKALIFRYSWLAYLLTLTGIPSFFLPSLAARSLSICLGTAFGFLVNFAILWAPERRRERAIAGHLLGLLALNSSRFAFSSLWPVWLSIENTYVGLAVGIVAALSLMLDADMRQAPTSPSRHTSSIFTDIRLGLGLGFSLFALHWVLSAHGVMARWLELDTYLFGLTLIVAMTLGVVLAYSEALVRSWQLYLLAVAAAPAMLYLHSMGWPLALFLAAYLMASWRSTLLDIGTHARPLLVLLSAGVIYVVGHLAVVWSVAWCFVPEGTGGPFMRDRAYQVFCLYVLFAGLLGHRSQLPEKPRSAPPRKVLVVLVMILALIAAPAVYKRSLSWKNYDGMGVQKYYIRGMAWAIRFGYNNRGWPNHADVARQIREQGANVISLVETDTLRPFNANWDVVEYLEEHLHMYSDYGPPTVTESWGCAILSAFPIIRSKRQVMPSPDGETACFIDATILVNGEEVDIISTHFGNTQHVRDRQLQAEWNARSITEKTKAGRKFVWLGYLTDKPGGPSYSLITGAGAQDVAPSVMERYCLYLFSRGFQVSNFTRIDTGVISDTEIQIANFK